MTLAAGEDTSRRIVVVTHRTPGAHRFHIRMKFVGECYRLIQTHQLVKVENIGHASGIGGNLRHLR